MKKIIDNPAYSRGYKYSLHALIDMSIKYSGEAGKTIAVEEIKYMNEKILELSKDDIDSYIISLLVGYIDYCNAHDLKKYCEPIISKHYEKINNIQKVTEEDYMVENLDWED